MLPVALVFPPERSGDRAAPKRRREEEEEAEEEEDDEEDNIIEENGKNGKARTLRSASFKVLPA